MRRLGVLMAVAESDADVQKGIAIFRSAFKSSAGRTAIISGSIIAGAVGTQGEFTPSRRSYSTSNPTF